MATEKTAAKSSSKAAAKSPVKRFRAKLEQDDSSTATAVTIPFDVEKTFGTRARVPVRGTINGFPFRTSIFPMGGCHLMVVNRQLREHEIMAWDFVLNFAKDNNLKVSYGKFEK